MTKFIMNRMALEQLRKSRNVVSVSVNGSKAGGDSSGSAPIPTHAHGIPILVTDSIVNNRKRPDFHHGHFPLGQARAEEGCQQEEQIKQRKEP